MKKKHLLSFSIHAISLGMAGVIGSLSPLGYAQEVSQQPEEVIVTGSRIKRVDLTSNSPISIIEAQDLSISNTVNPEEFLRDDPRFVAAVGSNTNNGNDGGATVDLRNLGEERTLVLFDGKRFTPYDYQGYVDLAMIPTALIERVEVITGGASAVYGSDAIGGVVNFIMKKDFSGVELDAATSSSFEGDAQRDDFSLTFGGNIDEGKGNVVANISYSKQDPVYQGDRKFSEFSLNNQLEPGGSPTNDYGVVFTSVDVPAFGAGGEDLLQFDANGNLGTEYNPFNFNPFNLLLAPQEKYTATVIADYAITDTIEFFSRVSFANNRVDTIIAPTGTFFFPYELNVDNPFLSATDQAALAELDTLETGAAQDDGVVDIAFGRRLTELGTRDSKYQNTTMQFVAGLRGEFNDDVDWELFAQKGRTSRTQNFLNDASFARTQQGMLATIDPDSGEIVCQDTSNGCVPVDYFGPGGINPDMANFIRLNLNETNETDQLILGGSASGNTPLTFPGATTPIGFAVGLEYRDESAVNRPDQNYATGNTIGFGSSSPVDAGIEITEYFAEIRVPVIEGLSFAESIVFEAAVRMADYENTVSTGTPVSNSFDNTSYKFGGEWAVTDEFRLRSLFQHAVRAPTMAEIGLPLTPSTGDLNVDYCAEPEALADAELSALCQATGVPAANVGGFTSIVAGQINNYIGGNPNLDPEEADTITAGFVYTSGKLPFTFSIDYYDIDIDNAIVELTEQSIVDACYLYERDANGTFCPLINRNPINGALIGGTETGVNASVINAGKESTKGIDIAASYNFDLNTNGSLDLRIDIVHELESISQDADFLDENDCAGLVGNICNRPGSEWRFVQSTTWAKGPLTLKLRWQYMSELKQDAIVLGEETSADYAKPTIDAFSYFDLFANFEVSENLALRAGITNLLDEEPPVVGNEYGGTSQNSGNTYPATYDPIGRSGFVGVNARF